MSKYENAHRGVNSRLDEIQAAVLRVKLRALDEWNARRSAIALRYLDRLQGSGLELPTWPSPASPAWHLFVVRSSERDALAEQLLARGVQTLIHYPIPPHLQAAYADLGWSSGAFPISERIHAEVLSLPVGPHLSDESQDRVVEAIRDATHL